MGDRAEARCVCQEGGQTTGACGRAAGTSLRAARRGLWSEANCHYFADRCIAEPVLAKQGLPKPDNYGPYGQNSRPWCSFCNGTAVGGKNKVVENRGNHIGFADRCIADQFWPIRGFQNPITANLMDKIPDHGAHFATERPLVVKNRSSKLFDTLSDL